MLLERAVSGGQAGTSPLIRNYPGFPHGINGGLLMERTCEQAWLMGAHIVFAQQVVALERRGGDRVVHLLDGTELRARAVVIATGIEWRRLGVRDSRRSWARASSTALRSARARACRTRTCSSLARATRPDRRRCISPSTLAQSPCVVRGDSFAKSMSSYLVSAIESTAERRRSPQHRGGGRRGQRVARIARRLLIAQTTRSSEVSAGALFIMIGGEPHTQWLPDEIARDEQGYLITGRDLLEQPECGLGARP